MILLDTHILIWMLETPSSLSARVQREIARANSILVSPISFFEVAGLLRLNRIRLDRDLYDWMRAVFEEPNVREAPLSATTATSAGLLGSAFPGDPNDRLLYCTARELGVPFASKDGRIRRFASEMRDVKVVW